MKSLNVLPVQLAVAFLGGAVTVLALTHLFGSGLTSEGRAALAAVAGFVGGATANALIAEWSAGRQAGRTNEAATLARRIAYDVAWIEDSRRFFIDLIDWFNSVFVGNEIAMPDQSKYPRTELSNIGSIKVIRALTELQGDAIACLHGEAPPSNWTDRLAWVRTRGLSHLNAQERRATRGEALITPSDEDMKVILELQKAQFARGTAAPPPAR